MTLAAASVEGTDPSQVAGSVPGDVASLRAWALLLAQLGSSGFGDVATRLDAARGVLTSWQGPASTAATDRLLATDHVWTDHGQQFGSLAQTVYWYAQVIEQAQAMARQAADLTAQGNTEHARYLTQYQLAAAYGVAAGDDPAPPFWQAAQDLLYQARRRVTAAEHVVIGALRQITAAAPTNPGIMADPRAALGRAWNTIKESAVGMVTTGTVADPSRHWLDTPGYHHDLTAIGTGLANGVDHAAEHPSDTILNTIDAATGDPAAATGSAAFAATTAVAGGVGTGLLKKGLTATGTALTSTLTNTARRAATNLSDWLRNSNLDVNTLLSQKRYGFPLGIAPTFNIIPDGPSLPLGHPGLFRIDPTAGPRPINTVEGIKRAWGPNLHLGEGSDQMLQRLTLIPPATMDLLAAHAGADDWTHLASYFANTGMNVAGSVVDRLKGARGKAGLYLGRDVTPKEVVPPELAQSLSGITSYDQSAIAAFDPDGALHEAGHGVHGLFTRSPQPGDPWPTASGYPHATSGEPLPDPFPGLVDQVYAELKSQGYTRGDVFAAALYDAPVEDVGLMNLSVHSRTAPWILDDGVYDAFHRETFAHGMSWYWGRDHSLGPAPLAGLSQGLRRQLWDYFHGYVPERLATSVFPKPPPRRR